MDGCDLAEVILENMFPELSADEAGLLEAMQIAFPGTEIPEEAFKKIQNSFNYIIGKDKSFFAQEFKTRNDRSHYKTKNQVIDWLNFEEYLTLILDVILFTQKFDPTLREIVREYYDCKGKRFEHPQTYLNSKVAELAVNLMIDPNQLPRSSNSQWKDFYKMKYPFCRNFLQAIFFDALGIESKLIKCLNSKDSFEEVVKGYLKFYEPGALLSLSLYDEEEEGVSSRGTKLYNREKVTSRVPTK